MSNPYWLFNWLDAHGIDTLEKAEQALLVPSQLEDLRDMAVLAQRLLPSKIESKNAILAGRSLDLTKQLSCSESECRQRQVDELFRKAWHYFDVIVVDDSVSHLVTQHWDRVAADPKPLLCDIEVLLYLRKIGAEDIVEFRQKPNVSQANWRLKASRAGLDSALDAAETLVPQLARDADIKVRPVGKGVSAFVFRHPKFEIVIKRNIQMGGISGKPTARVREAVAHEVLRICFPHLTADIRAAVALGIPLGCANWLHGEILSSASHSLAPAQIAFNLDLPILHGIPVETLIKLRHDEHQSFERFRDSLRLAIQERLKNDSSSNAAEISEQIRLDVIEPELRNIRDRLASAERVLSRKSVAGVFIGGLVTTCGILVGLPVPISIAAGIGAVGSTESSAVGKYIEEKQGAALSDLYFLWKAVRHSNHDF